MCILCGTWAHTQTLPKPEIQTDWGVPKILKKLREYLWRYSTLCSPGVRLVATKYPVGGVLYAQERAFWATPRCASGGGDAILLMVKGQGEEQAMRYQGVHASVEVHVHGDWVFLICFSFMGQANKTFVKEENNAAPGKIVFQEEFDEFNLEGKRGTSEVVSWKSLPGSNDDSNIHVPDFGARSMFMTLYHALSDASPWRLLEYFVFIQILIILCFMTERKSLEQHPDARTPSTHSLRAKLSLLLDSEPLLPNVDTLYTCIMSSAFNPCANHLINCFTKNSFID